MNEETRNIQQELEALLFVTNKPLSDKRLAKYLEVNVEVIHELIAAIKEELNSASKGWVLVDNEGSYKFTTHSACSERVQAFLQEELTGQLSRPALEALTIIAYRGPISKNELELIRGVNCTLILRNLQVRGLVKAKKGENGEELFRVTIEFLQFLGITEVNQLQDYDRLHAPQLIEDFLNRN